jgi:hypothetical protein
MPTALFVYVFTAKENPAGGIKLESPFRGVQRNPERLAQSGLVPSITRRNVTFKASFDFKKGEIKARDLKVIQAEVDRELRFSVGISKPYRVWNNAFMQIPALKANPELRSKYLNQIGSKSAEAQTKYQELISTGTISGAAAANAAPDGVAPVVADVQQAVADSTMEWGGEPSDISDARDQVAAVVSNGEGSFALGDEDDDGLADLIGGLNVGGMGGRRTYRSRRGKSKTKSTKTKTRRRRV